MAMSGFDKAEQGLGKDTEKRQRRNAVSKGVGTRAGGRATTPATVAPATRGEQESGRMALMGGKKAEHQRIIQQVRKDPKTVFEAHSADIESYNMEFEELSRKMAGYDERWLAIMEEGEKEYKPSFDSWDGWDDLNAFQRWRKVRSWKGKLEKLDSLMKEYLPLVAQASEKCQELQNRGWILSHNPYDKFDEPDKWDRWNKVCDNQRLAIGSVRYRSEGPSKNDSGISEYLKQTSLKTAMTEMGGYTKGNIISDARMATIETLWPVIREAHNMCAWIEY